MARRKKNDGRGRPWPEVQMGFMVVGVKTREPKALEIAFAAQLNKLCRKFGLDGVVYNTVGGSNSPSA